MTVSVEYVRVLVCGGRDYDHHKAWDWLQKNAETVVTEALSLNRRPCFTDVIHGGATGADAGAMGWGLCNGVCGKVYEADWKKYGKAAGPIRNQRMLDEGKPDVVIAFPGGRGTSDMVRRAKAAGVPVVRAG